MEIQWQTHENPMDISMETGGTGRGQRYGAEGRGQRLEVGVQRQGAEAEGGGKGRISHHIRLNRSS